MYQLKKEFRLTPETVSYLRSIDKTEQFTKSNILNMYSDLIDPFVRQDLVVLEKNVYSERDRTPIEIKLTILKWLADWQESKLDEDFFYRSLLTRPASRELLSIAVEKV